MASADLAAWVQAMAMVVSIYYLALDHRHRQRDMEATHSRPTRRLPILIIAILIVVSLCANGFNYYDRHYGPLVWTAPKSALGGKAPASLGAFCGSISMDVGSEMRGPIYGVDPHTGEVTCSIPAGIDLRLMRSR